MSVFLHTLLADAEQIDVWVLILLFLVPFFATLIIVPWIVVRLPADYFDRARRRPPHWGRVHPVLHVLLVILKNLAGFVVLLMGVAMLVLPGQGMLTILIGLLMLDFPGKFRAERWLVSRRPVLRSINWLRRKRHKAPLHV